MKNLVIFVTFFLVVGCSNTKVKPEEKKKTISESLKEVMLDVEAVSDLFIAFDVDKKYMVRGADSVTGSLDWVGYARIKGLENPLTAHHELSYFVRSGAVDKSIKFTPVTTAPQVAWSFNKGANMSAEMKAAIGSATAELNASSIYEITISKVGELSVPFEAFHWELFNSTVLADYVRTVPQNQDLNFDHYMGYASKQGVTTGGALYDIVFNEFKEVSIQGGADVSIIVKAQGKFYQKSSKVTKRSVFKLFYLPAATDGAAYDVAFQNRAALRTASALALSSALKSNQGQSSPTGLVRVADQIKGAFEQSAAKEELKTAVEEAQANSESPVVKAEK